MTKTHPRLLRRERQYNLYCSYLAYTQLQFEAENQVHILQKNRVLECQHLVSVL